MVEDRSRIPPGKKLDLMISNEVMGHPKKDDDWCPAYSVDITCAMEVIDQLKKRDKTIAFRWWPPHEALLEGGLWTAHVGIGRYDTVGETLAHAICLAALAALYDEVIDGR